MKHRTICRNSKHGRCGGTTAAVVSLNTTLSIIKSMIIVPLERESRLIAYQFFTLYVKMIFWYLERFVRRIGLSLSTTNILSLAR